MIGPDGKEVKPGGNGDGSPVPTEAELLEAKKKRFEENPDTFLEISEIVMCAVRNPSAGLGISIYVAGNRKELDISLMELQHAAFGIIASMKMREAADKGRIVTPHKRGVFGAFGRKQ